MSSHTRKTPAEIREHKNKPEPLVCLTSYTAPMTVLLDPHCDLLLVGDSVGTAIHGLENTLGVTLDMMVLHGQAVMRRAEKACVVVDMPYGTYEDSKEQAYESASRLMRETGCDAVKLEGGQDMAEVIAYLVENNIPVMGHIGLQPQSVIKEGGYKVKGKTDEDEARLLADAKAVEQAGAFSLVLEGTVRDVSQAITNAVSIPVIGIGAAPECDGQVLVIDDMIGMLDGHTPKFVKQYAQVKEIISEAAQLYSQDVKSRHFPSDEYLYHRLKS